MEQSIFQISNDNMIRFKYFAYISFLLTILVTSLLTLSKSNYPYTAYVYIDISAQDLLAIQFGYILTVGACFPGIAECILDIAYQIQHKVNCLFLYVRTAIILTTIIPAIGFIITSLMVRNDPQYFGVIVFVLLIVQRGMILPPLLHMILGSKSKIWTLRFAYVNSTIFYLSDVFALLAYSGNPYRTAFLTIHWTLFFLVLLYTVPYLVRYAKYLYNKSRWAEEKAVMFAIVITTKFLLQQLLTYAIFPYAVSPAHYQATNLVMLGTSSVITAVSLTILSTRLTRTRLADKIEDHNSFVRFVGHEVRTPLNISSVCSTLMSDIVDDETMTPEVKQAELRQLLEQQKDAFGLAVNILNDLIDFEKLEKADLALDCSRQNPIDFVLSCTPMFEVQTNEKNITLTLPRASDREAFREYEVYIDTFKLGKCLRNFISNACKFTPVGGFITVSVSKVEEATPASSSKSTFNFGRSSKTTVDLSAKSAMVTYIRISVTDSGVGISEENLPKLFNEVVQFDPNRLQEGKGSGLGLYMAKGIADLHKIRLRASSPGLGMGTTIQMDIPVASPLVTAVSTPKARRFKSSKSLGLGTKVGLRDTQDTSPLLESLDSTLDYTSITIADESLKGEAHSVGSLSQPPSPRALDLTGRRILVVDDSVPNVKVLAMLFSRMGAIVDTAVDGQQAVDRVVACLTNGAGLNAYYFILMDYNMPVMTGPDACRALRELGYTNPIFGLTGNSSQEEQVIFEQCGADYVFIKPLDITALKEVAGRLFGDGL